MARFTVHVPGFAASRESAIESAVLVRDGWHWGAFLFGPFWLMAHRHWLTGLVALVALVFALGGIAMLPVIGSIKVMLWLLVGWLFGIEGASLRRLALRRAGYDEAGVVVGKAGDALEERALGALLVMEPARPRAPGPVLGLFPKVMR